MARRWLPLAAFCVLTLGLAGVVRLGAQQPSPTPQGTAVPIRVVTQPANIPMATPIPAELDPDAPGLSREERFRRARIVLDQQAKYMREVEERRAQGETVFTPVPLPPGYRDRMTPTPSPTPPQTTNTLTSAGLMRHGSGKTSDTSGTRGRLGLTDQAKPPRATLFLNPASKTIRSGERFATQVRLLNPEHLAMDGVRIVLAYSAKSLKPVTVHQDALTSLLLTQPELTVEPSGVLRYVARLKKPLDGINIPLLTVEWEGLEPADGLEIVPATAQEDSAALWGRRAITAPLTGLNTTLAGARVNVRGEQPTTPQGARFIAPTLESMQPVLVGLPNQNSLRKPTLWIAQPATGTLLRAGDWLTIDLGINNPDHMAFDEVKLAGRFDPSVLDFADADEGNWIATGVNILDGPFHTDWPWDLHFTNSVESRFGFFEYHVAMTSFREQPSGALARIVAQVKKDTTAPVIEWVFDPKAGFDQPTTGVYLLGENVLTRGTELAREGEVATTIEGTLPGHTPEKAKPDQYRSPRP